MSKYQSIFTQMHVCAANVVDFAHSHSLTTYPPLVTLANKIHRPPYVLSNALISLLALLLILNPGGHAAQVSNLLIFLPLFVGSLSIFGNMTDAREDDRWNRFVDLWIVYSGFFVLESLVGIETLAEVIPIYLVLKLGSMAYIGFREGHQPVFKHKPSPLETSSPMGKVLKKEVKPITPPLLPRKESIVPPVPQLPVNVTTTERESQVRPLPQRQMSRTRFAEHVIPIRQESMESRYSTSDSESSVEPEEGQSDDGADHEQPHPPSFISPTLSSAEPTHVESAKGLDRDQGVKGAVASRGLRIDLLASDEDDDDDDAFGLDNPLSPAISDSLNHHRYRLGSKSPPFAITPPVDDGDQGKGRKEGERGVVTKMTLEELLNMAEGEDADVNFGYDEQEK